LRREFSVCFPEFVSDFDSVHMSGLDGCLFSVAQNSFIGRMMPFLVPRNLFKGDQTQTPDAV
jgi:hypothetical protein